MFTHDAYDAAPQPPPPASSQDFQCFSDKAILVKKSRRSGAGDLRWFQAFMHLKSESVTQQNQ
jgi:hypothetical protein